MRSRLLLLTIASLPALLAAELALRLLRPRAVGTLHQPCIYEPDARLGFRYRPGSEDRIHRHFEIDRWVQIDAWGLHDVAPSAAGAQGLRVAALGDSFTAHLYLAPELGWPKQLEAELQHLGYAGARVFNLGLDGTGTDVQLDLLERQLERVAPDVVLLAFHANDLEDVALGRLTRTCHRGFVLAYATSAQREVLQARVDAQLDRRWRRALAGLFRRSFLVRAVLYAALGARHPWRTNFLLVSRSAAQQARRGAPPDPAALLARLARLGRERGFRALVLPVPTLRHPEASLAVLRRAVPTLPLPVLDVRAELERRRVPEGLAHDALFWRHDNHLNVAGKRLFGLASAALLDRELRSGDRAADARAPRSLDDPASAPERPPSAD